MTPAIDGKKMNLQKIANDLLSRLSTRQKNVLTKRFGLKNGQRKTLEAIGDEYGITRERVRQIENDAKAAILKSEQIKALEPFFQIFANHFNAYGGARAEYVLFKEDVKNFSPPNVDTGIAAAHLHFLLSLGAQFARHSETDAFHSAWAVKNARVEDAKAALQQLIRRFEEKKELVKKETLLKWLSELSGGQDHKILESYLAMVKNVTANAYGEYGLTHWPEVRTRGVRDKAYLALKKVGQPMHFREIVAEINKAFSPKKPVHTQTVHNELIKDDKFVLVGRGTYALADWGYQPGRVSEVLARVLKNSNQPMTREEIVAAVCKERNVKPNTVLLNLQNKKYFAKMEDGRYVYKS